MSSNEERIRAAIQNSGFNFPQTRITANLAPAFLRKAGPGFDAALALAILAASGQVPAPPLAAYAVFGELRLTTKKSASSNKAWASCNSSPRAVLR